MGIKTALIVRFVISAILMLRGDPSGKKIWMVCGFDLIGNWFLKYRLLAYNKQTIILMSSNSNILRDSKSFAPFLSKKLSFVRGLDPLGLSNTSDATFSMLLPGLNNVTGRIRYYSFYCWLLSQYEQLEVKKEQRFFIRKAEY